MSSEKMARFLREDVRADVRLVGVPRPITDAVIQATLDVLEDKLGDVPGIAFSNVIHDPGICSGCGYIFDSEQLQFHSGAEDRFCPECHKI